MAGATTLFTRFDQNESGLVDYLRDSPARHLKKKICMVTYSNYRNDARVRKYAEALVNRGDEVDILSLSIDDEPLGVEEINGVSVHRIQRRQRNENRKWTFAWRLLRFLLTSARYLSRRHRKLRYDLIHVHNIPDFLVFSAVFAKRTGARVILDIHDVVPELFANKFGGGEKGGFFKLLQFIEAKSCHFADHVIVANHLWHRKLMGRSVKKDKCSTIVNYVDQSIFYRRTRTRDDGKFVLLFPGTFQWHQGLDIAIEAMPRILEKLPHAELHLLGAGNAEKSLRDLVLARGLEASVKFFPMVSLQQVAERMANADIGLIPKRADSFGNQAYSTKTLEFMSQGIPTVISRTEIDAFYFTDSVTQFFEPGNSRSLAEAVLQVSADANRRQELIANGLAHAEENSWKRKKADYLNLVDSLTRADVAARSRAAMA